MCCQELLQCGVMRMILSDPMFKRMEAVLRAREADTAAGAFNDGGDRNFSMNAVSSAAAADAGVADGVGGGNSVGSVADVWRGRGFGLGPTDYRGYDGGILERSAAHRVWCLATQVRSALVTLCSSFVTRCCMTVLVLQLTAQLLRTLHIAARQAESWARDPMAAASAAAGNGGPAAWGSQASSLATSMAEQAFDFVEVYVSNTISATRCV